MGKCPYCSKELHLEDFFEVTKKETKKGKVKVRVGDFIGETLEPRRSGPHLSWGECRMWVCPSCDTILGFTDYAYSGS
ncbi:MAG: hypothetical protein HWN81_14320 [Candidatus Lokiarchaeota archaeon]|nr:hypothetical protein [Candidatus Lokiarchaeota archaeon]